MLRARRSVPTGRDADFREKTGRKTKNPASSAGSIPPALRERFTRGSTAFYPVFVADLTASRRLGTVVRSPLTRPECSRQSQSIALSPATSSAAFRLFPLCVQNGPRHPGFSLAAVLRCNGPSGCAAAWSSARRDASSAHPCSDDRAQFPDPPSFPSAPPARRHAPSLAGRTGGTLAISSSTSRRRGTLAVAN